VAQNRTPSPQYHRCHTVNQGEGVGFLDNFERSLERAVGGAFAKTFKSGIHPLEIVAAVKREMDARATIVSRERILVPSEYVASLSHADHERLSELGTELLDEIVAEIASHRAQQGYQSSDALRVALQVDPALSEGMVQAHAILPKDGVVWIPVLEFEGTKYPLVQRRTVVGRGSDVDVVITGRGLSRRHFQVIWDRKRAEIADRGSPNGTELNGQPVTRAALPDRCTITAGEARIVMGVIPQQQARYQALVDSGRPPQTKETS
jgi:hypothetical protein